MNYINIQCTINIKYKGVGSMCDWVSIVSLSAETWMLDGAWDLGVCTAVVSRESHGSRIMKLILRRSHCLYLLVFINYISWIWWDLVSRFKLVLEILRKCYKFINCQIQRILLRMENMTLCIVFLAILKCNMNLRLHE